MLEQVHQVKHREENKSHERLAALKTSLLTAVYQSESKVLGALLLYFRTTANALVLSHHSSQLHSEADELTDTFFFCITGTEQSKKGEKGSRAAS